MYHFEFKIKKLRVHRLKTKYKNLSNLVNSLLYLIAFSLTTT